MKTKILFFFLLLVMGVGNGFAENTSRDSLFQEITKNPRSFAKNWNTIPGSDNDKFLAILTGKTIQIKDSIRTVDDRWFGILLFKKVDYTRHIYYDETNKLLKKEIKFSQEKYDLVWIFLSLCAQSVLLFLLRMVTDCLSEDYRTTFFWIAWCIFLGILIFVSCYLGTLCGIISLIYIFKDKIRESIENFLQQKGRKERKEQKTKKKINPL